MRTIQQLTIRPFSLKGVPGATGVALQIEGEPGEEYVTTPERLEAMIDEHDLRAGSTTLDLNNLNAAERAVLLRNELRFSIHIGQKKKEVGELNKAGALPLRPGNALDALIASVMRNDKNFDWSAIVEFGEMAPAPEEVEEIDLAPDDVEELAVPRTPNFGPAEGFRPAGPPASPQELEGARRAVTAGVKALTGEGDPTKPGG